MLFDPKAQKTCREPPVNVKALTICVMTMENLGHQHVNVADDTELVLLEAAHPSPVVKFG